MFANNINCNRISSSMIPLNRKNAIALAPFWIGGRIGIQWQRLYNSVFWCLQAIFTLLMPKQQKSANSPFNVISQRLYHPPLHKYTERNSIAYITQYLSIFVFPMTKRQNLGNSPFNIIAPHSSHRPCTYTPKGTQFRRSPDYLAYTSQFLTIYVMTMWKLRQSKISRLSGLKLHYKHSVGKIIW